ncbi:hypothetical protein C0J50_12791 [Silurus asotus]|uniref:Uncharacterized protein n=1 Tax=Silurus asotus TaxID=30991 RepID=A0AAD5B6M2_SILAS|nr:hypothetical protein C0J50_12791 [Silurus asotus]
MNKSQDSTIHLSTESPNKGSDDRSYRRRLQRGETVDGFIHPPENSKVKLNHAKYLSRSHTIHQDLTCRSRKDLEHTQCCSTTTKMTDSGANDHSINLSYEPEQIIEMTEENMQSNLEEEENKDKNLHWVSTEMDDLVL